MKLALTDESWILEALNPIEWRFLSELPHLASGRELPPDALKRLKPDPIDPLQALESDESAFEEDWREFVEPDLDRLFSEARDRVIEDLAAAIRDSDLPLPERIEIANDNSEPWFSVINQARLLMNEVHGMADASERFDPEVFGESEKGVERILLLAQYEFYTAIQSILLEYRMDP